jgi:hypothetical protein
MFPDPRETEGPEGFLNYSIQKEALKEKKASPPQGCGCLTAVVSAISVGLIVLIAFIFWWA